MANKGLQESFKSLFNYFRNLGKLFNGLQTRLYMLKHLLSVYFVVQNIAAYY